VGSELNVLQANTPLFGPPYQLGADVIWAIVAMTCGLSVPGGSTASGMIQRQFTSEPSHTDRISQTAHNTLLRNGMNTELTEEEMRLALFGESKSPAPAVNRLFAFKGVADF